MPTTQVRGIEIYYERQGSGPRLLFIGGSGGDLRYKPGVLDGPLPKQFEVLAYDQRGLGQSGRPPGPYTMANYAEDAADLLDAVGWDRCHVIGVSFGGMVGQELACRFPDRVERLVLACTSSGGAGGSSYPLHELQDLSARQRSTRMIEIADTRIDAAWRDANPSAFSTLIEASERRASVGADEPGRAEGQRLQLEARRGHDTYDRLSGLDMPVYICAGLHDGIAAPHNQRQMLEAIPGASLDFFIGGHMFLLQDRSALPKMAKFLLET